MIESGYIERETGYIEPTSLSGFKQVDTVEQAVQELSNSAAHPDIWSLNDSRYERILYEAAEEEFDMNEPALQAIEAHLDDGNYDAVLETFSEEVAA